MANPISCLHMVLIDYKNGNYQCVSCQTMITPEYSTYIRRHYDLNVVEDVWEKALGAVSLGTVMKNRNKS